VTAAAAPPADQVSRKPGAFVYRPLPRQKVAHDTDAPNVLFGGAAGGSKSHWLRWHLIKACLKYPGLRTLLLRRQFTELEQTHLLAIRTEVPKELARYISNVHRLEFPNGSILQFGHCNTDADFASYLSTEWGMIGVDEATQFTPYQLTMLPSRLRTTLPDFRTQYCLASNPGGPGHLWLKSRFLEQVVDPEEHPGYKPEEWRYVPSRVQDNPYLTDNYVDRLRQLPEHARRAYLEGDWDVFSGQAFAEWRLSHHVKAFEPPPDWRWFAGMDWGYSKPGCVLFLAAGPEDLLVRRELYFRKQTPYEVGYLVGTMAKALPQLEYVAGDSAMWAVSDGGPSVAEECQKGITDAIGHDRALPLISVAKGPGSRQAGKQLVHEALRFTPAADGTIPRWSGAKLRVHPECKNLIRTLPALPVDPDKPEDVDTEAEDHAYDALRYALASRAPHTERDDHQRVPDDVHPGFDIRGRRRKPKYRTPEEHEDPDDGSVRLEQAYQQGRYVTGIRYGGARPFEEEE
jgi:phage terminase large subunit